MVVFCETIVAHFVFRVVVGTLSIRAAGDDLEKEFAYNKAGRKGRLLLLLYRLNATLYPFAFLNEWHCFLAGFIVAIYFRERNRQIAEKGSHTK